MSVASAPSKILVTGANGYIAMWVIDTLLKSGYTVRGTVRSIGKSRDLEKTFHSFVDDGKLEFVVVNDISEEGAFDTAVVGIDAIIHMASPVTLNADDPRDLIGPAMAGTLGILQSALKHGDALRRIVFTSSTAAVSTTPVSKATAFRESDWNTESVEEVERLGRHARPMHKYRASKTLAEKAIWKFIEEHKNDLSWDVVTINPPFVFGPALNILDDPSQQNATAKMWWDNVVAKPPTREAVAVDNSYADVRDVALAHVLALQKAQAGGERLIIAAGAYVWQDWLDIASRHHFPLKSHRFPHHQNEYSPKGFPDIERNRFLSYDTSKAQRLLGPELKYRSMEETTRDILQDYIARGW